MKETKPLAPEQADNTATRPGPTEKRTPGETAPAPASAPGSEARKPRGLNRESLRRLGRVLETYFEDVRNEGVPERFRRLLEDVDERQKQAL